MRVFLRWPCWNHPASFRESGAALQLPARPTCSWVCLPPLRRELLYWLGVTFHAQGHGWVIVLAAYYLLPSPIKTVFGVIVLGFAVHYRNFRAGFTAQEPFQLFWKLQSVKIPRSALIIPAGAVLFGEPSHLVRAIEVGAHIFSGRLRITRQTPRQPVWAAGQNQNKPLFARFQPLFCLSTCFFITEHKTLHCV